MPKIASIAVTAARVPLDHVTSFSSRTVSARDYGLIKIRSDEGVEGVGFCYVGSAGGEILPVAVEHLLAPMLLGADSHEVEGLWKKMYQESILQGRAGVVMRAISIIDTALWDLNARSAGLALHRFLGAAQLTSVPAYASGGYYLEGKTPAKLGEEMAGYVAQGFKAVKMKTGRLSPAQEEDRLRAARDAGTLPAADVETLLDALELFTELRLEHQVDQMREGLEPDDFVDPDELSALTRSHLKEAFRAVASLQKRIAAELDLRAR